MNDIIKQALLQYGLPTVFAVGVVWVWFKLRLVKSIEHEYAKKLEKYSNDLSHESELAIKIIEAKANERNIKLTKTFDTQAEIIATAYRKLVAVLRDAKAYLIFGGGDSTNKDVGGRLHDFQKLVQDCLDYVDENKIYFPRKNSDHMFALTNSIQNLVLYSDIVGDYGQFGIKDETKLQELKESKMKLQKNINEILKLLEGGFQELLGFPDTYTKSEVELFTEELAEKKNP